MRATQARTLAEQHADLLTRLATGGDLDLLRAMCHALAAAREAGDVCVDLLAWSTTEPEQGEPARPDVASARRALLQTGVVAAGSEDAPRLPLVLDDRDRLYALRHFAAERRIAGFVAERLARPPLRTPAEVRRSLDATGLEPEGDDGQPDLQLAAVVAGASRSLTILCGGPGTGKTTTVTKLMSVLLHHEPHLRVAVAAPTGKAAARLGEALKERAVLTPSLAGPLSQLQPKTLHRLLSYLPQDDKFRFGRDRELPYDLVVVDEVSMVDPSMFAALCDALADHARLVLVGDKDQLAAVAAGQVLGDLTHAARPERGLGPALAAAVRAATGMDVPAQPDAAPIADATVILTKNHRFGAQPGIGGFAEALVLRDPAAALEVLRAGHDDLALVEDIDAALAAVLPDLEQLLLAARGGDPKGALRAITHVRVLTALRLGPTGAQRWNRRIEQALRAKGHDLDALHYVGRPILVTANDHGNGVWNGDLGVCGRDEQGQSVVWLRDQHGAPRALNPRRLPAHETAWAMTVHKAQGSEFERVLLAMPDQQTQLNHAALIYTGVTRARRNATICADPALLEQGLSTWPSRRSGLADALKHPRS